MLPVFVQRHDLHGNMPGVGILLQLTQHRPSEHVGKEHVERDRRRLVLARERQRVGAAHRHEHLEALVVRQVDEDARVVRVVLDDEERRIARLEIVAVVGNGFDRPIGQRGRPGTRTAHRARHASSLVDRRPHRRARRIAAGDTA